MFAVHIYSGQSVINADTSISHL